MEVDGNPPNIPEHQEHQEHQSSFDKEATICIDEEADAAVDTIAADAVVEDTMDGDSEYFGDMESSASFHQPSRKRKRAEQIIDIGGKILPSTEREDSESTPYSKSGPNTLTSKSRGIIRVTEAGVTVDDLSTLRTDDSIFAVVNEYNYPGSPSNERVRVEIWNISLRECLQESLAEISDSIMAVSDPILCPKLLFLYLDELERQYDSLTKREADSEPEDLCWIKKESLKLLIDYLKTKFAVTIKDLELLLGRGLITFDLLWVLWKPRTLLFSSGPEILNIPTVSMLMDTTPRVNNAEGKKEKEAESITSRYIKLDGNTIKLGLIRQDISRFEGAIKITSLGIYPLKYHKNEAQVRMRLLERGSKYLSLQEKGIHQKSFTGIAARRLLGYRNVDMQQERIVIDALALRMLTRPHDEPQETTQGITFVDECDEEILIDGIQLRSLLAMLLTKKPREGIQAIQDGGQTVEGLQPSCAESETEARVEKAKDTFLLLCSPYIAAYSLAHWEWLIFPISGIEDVKWNSAAWDSLVLHPETKGMILSRVKSSDTIRGVWPAKEQGLTIMLYGPSGTGKTLTVEALADHLQRPLMKLSPASLELPHGTLDETLDGQRMLEVCQRWDAIVLIDDAGELLKILSARRPLSYSIVLRHLKSPLGVMFVTRSSIGSCEDLDKVRIYLSFHITNPTKKGRMEILQRSLERAKTLGLWQFEPFTEEEVSQLAEYNLNGREIQTVVRLALDWASEMKEAVGAALLERMVSTYEQHKREFQGANWSSDHALYS
ncbi:hypothetical protein V8C42DRAFT_358502 [Trichoderma barbatum]